MKEQRTIGEVVECLREDVTELIEYGFTLQDLQKMFRATVTQLALEERGGNQCAAARMLGVHRNTFMRLMQEASIPTKRMQRGEVG